MKIQHDFHIHSHLSVGGKEEATVEYYIKKAKELGLEKIGFSDHMWDSNIPGAPEWYLPQDFNHIVQLKDEIANTDTQGVDVYFGCEIEYNFPARDIAITEEIVKELDFLLVPISHTHLTMPKEYYTPYEKHAKYMLTAFMDAMESKISKYVTAIAHPFYAIGCPYDNRELFKIITDADFEECFKAAKEKDIALEINRAQFKTKSAAEVREDPSIRMYHIAKECGCKFTVGSDSHNINGYDRFENVFEVASLIGLTNDDFADITQ